MLTEVADGVWVRQSEWVWTNSIVVRGEDGLILVDPGINGSELNELADHLDQLGVPVVAGFSTHPHWDHLLWDPRFGEVPRYATAAGSKVANQSREQARAMAAQSASGIPPELIGIVTPLPANRGPVPGEILEHDAHAIGHAAVLLADRGVLLAGDMLSDVLIPLLDHSQRGQVHAYETALAQLERATRHVDVMVPGHGAVARGPEITARVAADRAYIESLRRGEEPVDARLEADWLAGPNRSNVGAGPKAVGRGPDWSGGCLRESLASGYPAYERPANSMHAALAQRPRERTHEVHFTRTGAGTPLLLIHGIGGTHRSWDPIAATLAAERELIAVDLPGHGQSAPLAVTTIATYADALERFIAEHQLAEVDVVGASMGARLALELARRGSVGNVVALDPGGFWTRTEQRVFGTSVRVSVLLLRVLKPLLPWLTGNPVTRTLLLGQFSGRPWALDRSVVLPELLSFLDTVSFAEALDALANGPTQEGAETVPGRVVVGWGKRDLVTLPRQSRRLKALFPMAEIEMYERCGHFPYWDAPDRAVQTILRATQRTNTPLSS